jgi:monothiol glutaredoxin
MSQSEIDSRNAPAEVRQLTATELKRLMDEGVSFELFDVRTPEERAIAKIDGARLLDEETAAYVDTLPKDRMLVFHCHHGMRSQDAAEYFRDRGFRNTHNLVGGIDAWSLEVAPDVPRY